MIVNVLTSSLKLTVSQVVILLGPGLVLAAMLHYLANAVNGLAYRRMGRGAFLALFGWLGVATHELGHAFFCLVFGHQVTEISLFTPDNPHSLGHVNHRWNSDSLYQEMGNFFIGIGPLIFGGVVIVVAAQLLVGGAIFAPLQAVHIDSNDLSSSEAASNLARQLVFATGAVVKSFFSTANLVSWQFWLFLWIAFSVGSNMTLSPPDIAHAFGGFISLLICLFALNVGMAMVGGVPRWLLIEVANYTSIINSVMVFALILNSLFFVVLRIVRDV